MEMTNFTVVSTVLHNNYWSRNLIGPYRFRVISPKNLTLFTRPFLPGRRTRAGHETTKLHGGIHTSKWKPALLTTHNRPPDYSVMRWSLSDTWLELCSHHIYNTGDTSSFVLHVTVSVRNACTKLYIESQSPMKLSWFLDRWYHIPVTGTWKSHRQFTPDLLL